MTQDHKTQNSKPGPEGIIGFMKGFLATQPHNFCFGCIAPLGCTDAPRSDAAAICCKNCGSGAGGAAYPVQSVRSLQRIACWLCAKKTRSKYLRNQSQTQRNYMVNYMVSRVLRIQTGAGSGNSLMSSELHS